MRETAGTKKRKRNRNKPKQIETIRICHKTLRGKKRGNGSITQSVRSRMISNAPVNIYIYIVKWKENLDLMLNYSKTPRISVWLEQHIDTHNTRKTWPTQLKSKAELMLGYATVFSNISRTFVIDITPTHIYITTIAQHPTGNMCPILRLYSSLKQF